MKQLGFVHKDLLVCAAISAAIVFFTLLPYLRDSDAVRMNMHYRAELLFVSTLALPLIDAVLSYVDTRNTTMFMAVGAFIVWIVNTAAFFLAVVICRLVKRLPLARFRKSIV